MKYYSMHQGSFNWEEKIKFRKARRISAGTVSRAVNCDLRMERHLQNANRHYLCGTPSVALCKVFLRGTFLESRHLWSNFDGFFCLLLSCCWRFFRLVFFWKEKHAYIFRFFQFLRLHCEILLQRLLKKSATATFSRQVIPYFENLRHTVSFSAVICSRQYRGNEWTCSRECSGGGRRCRGTATLQSHVRG